MKKEKSKKTPMKKRIGVTAKETGMGLLGVVGGTGVAAGLGSLGSIAAPLAGIIMLGAGCFLGGKWKILKLAGAATVGYGIAKAQSNRIEGTIKDHFITFKDNWLNAFYIDKLINKGEVETETEEPTIGAIDLSELDDFDERLKESAIKFQMSQMEESKEANSAFEFENDDDEELTFTMMDEDDFDFNDF